MREEQEPAVAAPHIPFPMRFQLIQRHTVSRAQRNFEGIAPAPPLKQELQPTLAALPDQVFQGGGGEEVSSARRGRVPRPAQGERIKGRRTPRGEEDSEDPGLRGIPTGRPFGISFVEPARNPPSLKVLVESKVSPLVTQHALPLTPSRSLGGVDRKDQDPRSGKGNPRAPFRDPTAGQLPEGLLIGREEDRNTPGDIRRKCGKGRLAVEKAEDALRQGGPSLVVNDEAVRLEGAPRSRAQGRRGRDGVFLRPCGLGWSGIRRSQQEEGGQQQRNPVGPGRRAAETEASSQSVDSSAARLARTVSFRGLSSSARCHSSLATS